MRTLLVKLKIEGEARQRVLETLDGNRKAWNLASEVAAKMPVLDLVKLHHKVYHKIRKTLQVPSQVVIKAQQDCIAAYKTQRSNALREARAGAKKAKIRFVKPPFAPLVPFVRKRLAMRLDKWLCTIKNGGVSLTAVGGKRVFAEFVSYPRLEKYLAMPAHDPLLFERDGQLWLAISFDEPQQMFVEGTAIGVDLGIKRAAVTSEGVIVSRRDFNRRLRKLAHLKAALQARKTKSARRHLKLLRRKHARMSADFDHCTANAILKTSATTIVVENLAGIKDTRRGTFLNRKLGQWSVGNLVMVLDYKALALGKRVITVNPAFTSQDDWRGIEAGTRKGRRYYASDGKVWDADWNASMNIAQRALGNIPISHREMLDGQARVNEPIVCKSSTHC